MNWTFPDQYNQLFDPNDNTLQRLFKVSRGAPTLRADSFVTPSGNYSTVPNKLLDGESLDLRSGSIVTRGALSPVGFTGAFGFTATTTSITIYWDGTNGSTKFLRLGVDGSVSNVTPGSLTISSLTANTSYGFLPFYSAYNTCGIGFVVGDSGSPQFAFTTAARNALAMQRQSLQGREPMSSGYITYSTPAAGTSSGGGGGSLCVMSNTHVETLGDLPYTEERHPWADWIRIKAKEYPNTLYCTPEHPLFHAERGKLAAKDFVVGDKIITDCGEYELEVVEPHRRVCSLKKISMVMGHLYWANGYLSHNAKAPWV